MMWPSTRVMTMNGVPSHDGSSSTSGSATGTPAAAAARCASSSATRSYRSKVPAAEGGMRTTRDRCRRAPSADHDASANTVSLE